ncbi:hypothetical protein HDU98_007421 [Podochytrium sp. JEL0797]|nr:hypothetical protein HDU98_007421 [Podochytrium sp. JEL0797]
MQTDDPPPPQTLEQDLVLAGLLAGSTDQSVLEKTLEKKLMRDLKHRETTLDQTRLAKTTTKLRSTRSDIDSLLSRLDAPNLKISTKRSLLDKISVAEEQVETLKREIREIENRIEAREDEVNGGERGDVDSPNVSRETQREMLIRTGKITPFDRGEGGGSRGGRSVLDLTQEKQRMLGSKKRVPPVKRRKESFVSDEEEGEAVGGNSDASDEYIPESREAKPSKRKVARVSDSESEGGALDEDEIELLEEDEDGTLVAKKNRETVDDGNEYLYQRRYAEWVKNRRIARFTLENPDFSYDSEEDEPKDSPLNKDIPSEPFYAHSNDLSLSPHFHIPHEITLKLFPYQLTTLSWLHELHTQQVGGILGDEMGLGKTIQLIAFLAGLHRSRMLGKGKPILVIAPATVMNQWVKEFHEWWGAMRVVILHASGSGVGNLGAVSEEEMSDSEEDGFSSKRKRKRSETKDSVKAPRKRNPKAQKQIRELVDRVVEMGHVILTTYEGLRVYRENLVPVNWAYAVLDEGHKIRNADAEITLVCKKLRTPHRIILSGTPIQNNLKELWSLYDFVFPGRLGTLPVFLTQFEVPIRLGAYANASNIQVQTAQRCAAVLRDLISPYLLRRLKCDVAADLPQKTESVLFCKLTKEQRALYEEYIRSDAVVGAIDGKRNALGAIDGVRKICNHPDLLNRDADRLKPDYGNPSRSGKMQVVLSLLSMWKKQGHRALVFCQTRQVQEILEKLVANEGYKFLRMDGMTPIKNRIGMVDNFNSDPSITVFLLTTKVGGLGLNLTGANRVLIFDPDWNPSTDIQARERAWRLGQTRSVAVYRLMMSGTIEEKIYHRQIYKQFLTNKILTDGGVGQKRFFDSRSMRDLFTLTDEGEIGTETGDMFRGTEVVGKEDVRASGKSRKRKETGYDLIPVGKSPVKLAPSELAPVEIVDSDSEEEDEDALEQISALAKVEDFQTGEAPEQPADPAEDGQEESRMLFSLLHSTVAHDKIMGGDGAAVDPLASAHADRVAREAAEQVRSSRKKVRAEQKRAAQAHGGYVGVVTYTGTFGSAGRQGASSSSSSGVRRPTDASTSSSPGGSSALSSREGERGGGGSSSTSSSRPPSMFQFGKSNAGASGSGSGLSSASLLDGLKKRFNTK